MKECLSCLTKWGKLGVISNSDFSATKQTQWQYLGAETVLLIRHRDVASDSNCRMLQAPHFLHKTVCVTPLKSSTCSCCSALTPGTNSELQLSGTKQGQLYADKIFAKMRQKLIGELQISLGLAGADLCCE